MLNRDSKSYKRHFPFLKGDDLMIQSTGTEMTKIFAWMEMMLMTLAMSSVKNLRIFTDDINLTKLTKCIA